MIYVGHIFRWKPETDELLFIARRWDYQWCRMWSDKSFQEAAEFFHALRGKSWYWRQDGNSLPYYLLTPVFRERALKLGALIRDWDNPQLPPGTVKTYHEKKHIEKDRETLVYQQQTQGGSIPVLLTEEDLLKTTSALRGPRQPAHPSPLHGTGDANPPQAAPGPQP